MSENTFTKTASVTNESSLPSEHTWVMLSHFNAVEEFKIYHYVHLNN
jgi:hypothetical protein